jgi:hypothetical protein
MRFFEVWAAVMLMEIQGFIRSLSAASSDWLLVRHGKSVRMAG